MPDSKLAQEQVDALYRQHAAGVQRFLLGVLRDGELADEALQGTFLQLVERGHTAEESTMKGWIYKVAFHQAMALRRRGSAAIAQVQAGLDPELLLTPDPRGDAQADAIEREAQAQARAAVRALPAAQQQVLHLRFVEAKTFAQIAAELGVPLGTALTRMRLALEKLRRKLQS